MGATEWARPRVAVVAFAALVTACTTAVGASPSATATPVQASPHGSALAGAPSPVGPTDLPSSTADPTATTTPAQPTATARPRADLVGRFDGDADLEVGCTWLTDADDKSWEILWPDGYDHSFDGNGEPVLLGGGEVLARAGDLVGLTGSPGAEVEGYVVVTFRLRLIDPSAAAQGRRNARAEVVRPWAAERGLEIQQQPRWESELGLWEFKIVDGTPAIEKEAALNDLPEVDIAFTETLLSFCQVGSMFTATGIAFIEQP